jgi:surface polysaccharide O-acyltransferase-like enzyme
MAVPVFFMISGALLLPKQESYKESFTKRVLRMAVILILISVPYYAWLHRSQGLSVSSFLTYIYSNSASTSLWYLYSYIALLLMMPFLRNMVKGLKEKDFLYLIAGYILVSGVIPCLESCLWWADVTIHKSFNPILFMMPNVFYAIIGYYLEYVMDNHKNKKRRTILGIVFSIIALAITCFMTHRQLLNIQEYSTDQLDRFFSCFICIPAMTLYDIFKCSEEKARSATTQKLLPIFGGAVFGVYLIEKFA